MEERILDIMRNVFEDASVDVASNQNNCPNWDSLRQLTLVSELEDEFDVEFEPEEIAQMRSFTQVREILMTKF